MNKSRMGAYCLASILIVAASGGRLYGIMPFGAPMLCALVTSVRSGAHKERFVFAICASALYLLCAFMFTFDYRRLAGAGVTVFVMISFVLASIKSEKLRSSYAAMGFSVGAIALESVFTGLFYGVTAGILTFFVACFYLYFAVLTAAVAAREFAFGFSSAEGAALCVTLAVFGLTFGRAIVEPVNVGAALTYFTGLILVAIGTKAAISGAAAMAFGLALGDKTLALALLFGIATAAIFRSLPRPVYAICGAAAISAFCVLFGGSGSDAVWTGVACIIGALPFIAIPKRAVKAFTQYFDRESAAKLAVRHYINKQKADTAGKLYALSSVFDETSRLLNGFAPPPPDHAAAGAVMRDNVCGGCKNFDTCDVAVSAEAFTALSALASGGRVPVTELPRFFTEKCIRTADAVTLADDMSRRSEAEERQSKADERARAAIADRMGAVSGVLSELARDGEAPVGFDANAEAAFAAELNARGIECAAAFVTKNGITAIVRTESADKAVLAAAAKACFKHVHEVGLEKTSAAGWSVATLKKKPRYEAAYARAGIAKTENVSGDGFGFERIEGKFLVTLVDGMGTGGAAATASDSAIAFIECFYRAGFDSRSAFSAVNRFLKLPQNERFSAADVAVVDLDTGMVDIIKLGAPPCYIKTADTVLKVEGSSLPIGILDEVRPYTVCKKLYAGQMLIMVSDGVSDAFESGDALARFINDLAALNPERTASAILSRALTLSGDEPKDDMTVIAVRLFETSVRVK